MTRTPSAVRTVSIAAAVVMLTGTLWTHAQAAQRSRPPQTAAIEIDNFKFGVASLEITVGTTVAWTNRDDVPHTVTSSTKTFKSPPLDTGDTFTYTFKEAGVFEYYCSLHPHMTGKIVVK